jgi:competence protein ComFB
VELKNYMENLVWEHLDQVISGHRDVCPCERCRYDIVAIALNFLPPRYVVTAKGETWAKAKALDQQFYVDIVSAITNAIILVKSRPHHNRTD